MKLNKISPYSLRMLAIYYAFYISEDASSFYSVTDYYVIVKQ
jgi:hypothetical protein